MASTGYRHLAALRLDGPETRRLIGYAIVWAAILVAGQLVFAVAMLPRTDGPAVYDLFSRIGTGIDPFDVDVATATAIGGIAVAVGTGLGIVALGLFRRVRRGAYTLAVLSVFATAVSAFMLTGTAVAYVTGGSQAFTALPWWLGWGVFVLQLVVYLGRAGGKHAAPGTAL
jgi:hypothetical protein